MARMNVVDFELILTFVILLLTGGVALFNPLLVVRLFAAMNSGSGAMHAEEKADKRELIEWKPDDDQYRYASAIMLIQLTGIISWFFCIMIVLMVVAQ